MIGAREFKCWNTHGSVDLIQAIAQSCDVFFYKLGIATGGQLIHDCALKLGMGRPTGIELPYEAAGYVPNPFWKRVYKFQRWYDGDTANFVIGQGELLTSPLQICRLGAVFASRGNLLTPYIILAIDGKDVSAGHRKVSQVHLSAGTIERVREGMRQAVASDTRHGPRACIIASEYCRQDRHGSDVRQ